MKKVLSTSSLIVVSQFGSTGLDSMMRRWHYAMYESRESKSGTVDGVADASSVCDVGEGEVGYDALP